MAGAEPDFFYPFSDDCKNFMTQRTENAYVFLGSYIHDGTMWAFGL